jgi:hypothetical protein
LSYDRNGPAFEPGISLAIGYLAMFLVAECLTLYGRVFHTAQSEFSGLWLILVGVPGA